MTTYAGLIAAMLNPFDAASAPLTCVLSSLFIMGVVAVTVGCIESLMARLRMRLVPRYLMMASALSALCLLAAGWLVRSS
jgi:formate hydrogenlyase subunit 4